MRFAVIPQAFALSVADRLTGDYAVIPVDWPLAVLIGGEDTDEATLDDNLAALAHAGTPGHEIVNEKANADRLLRTLSPKGVVAVGTPERLTTYTSDAFGPSVRANVGRSPLFLVLVR